MEYSNVALRLISIIRCTRDRTRNGLAWRGRSCHIAQYVLLMFAFAPFGCQRPASDLLPPRPDVSPRAAEGATETEALALDASVVQPMYRELVAVDLPTVVRVATAQNFDVRMARYQVEQWQGRYESVVGGVFPALVPTALFEHVEGRVRATEGKIVNVGFNTFSTSIAVQWVLNPGRVVYELIASKKRVLASELQEDAVRIETLRRAANQYYSLVLAQAAISTAQQAVVQAEELLRINRLRSVTGAGVPADELRAEARLAGTRQDLFLAMNELYRASLDLVETLQLDDPTVTLVPAGDELPPTTLVRDDIPIEELLGIAMRYRPDLEGVRLLAAAAGADRGATWWGSFGPEFQVAYQYGGITGHSSNTKPNAGIPGNLIVNPFSGTGGFSGNPLANGLIKEGILRGSRAKAGWDDETFGFSDQQMFSSGVGSRWSLSAIGDLKSAGAMEQQQILEAQRVLNLVRTQVVRAQQASKTHRDLIELSRHETVAAEEALRLTQASLEAGAMTTLDVLQAQEAVAQAQLRSAGAVVRYNQAEVNLLAAIGLLDEQSFEGIAGTDENDRIPEDQEAEPETEDQEAEGA